jgi:hypothetical protein
MKTRITNIKQLVASQRTREMLAGKNENISEAISGA